MAPGAVEEIGKTTGLFFQIMKDQPLSLALVVMNLVLLGFFFFIADKATANRKYEFEALLESQKEVNKLLYQCVPAGPRSELMPLPMPRPLEANR